MTLERMNSHGSDDDLRANMEDVNMGIDDDVAIADPTVMAGDGLMRDWSHQGPTQQRRTLFRSQRVLVKACAALCLAVVVVLVGAMAASGGISEDDVDTTDPLEYGYETTVSDQPPPVHGQHVPAMAPVHSSFDQPSIAAGDPVGDPPSVSAGDMSPWQTAPPTTTYQATLPVFTIKAMREPSSPQSKAWSWLMGHPEVEDMEDWRKKQLIAMATFFYAYDGDSWTDKEKQKWLSYEWNECLWGAHATTEAECRGDKKIRTIRLENQDKTVQGFTPLEMSLMENLERFELSNLKLGNNLFEALPAHLTEMKNLDRVRLSDVYLTGTIPTYVGFFTKLTSLNLRSNHLSGTIPTSLGQMTNLKYLTLYGNNLEGPVPSQLARLTNLVSLSIQDNKLTGSLPASLCALTNLQRLEVDCQKTTCPMACDCVCKDPKLIRGTATPTSAPRDPTPARTQYPTMAPNDGILLGLPEHSFKALSEFNSPQFAAYAWILNHPMLDKMPEWRKEQLFGLVSFYHAFAGVWSSTERNLWLDYDTHECDWGIGLCDFDNRFLKVTLEDAENVNVKMIGSGIPRELSMLPLLEDIELYGLDLEVSMETLLPIGDLQYLPLITINLQGNKLSGSIPSDIASLRTLRNLSLARNRLNTTIPTEFGLLQDLKHLTLHENADLNGPLPSQLGQLTQLETLWVDRTDIAGTVPKEICNLPSLQTLRVDCDKMPCPANCKACRCFESS